MTDVHEAQLDFFLWEIPGHLLPRSCLFFFIFLWLHSKGCFRAVSKATLAEGHG